MLKVLISDKVHPHLIDSLRKMSFDVDYRPDISYPDTLNILPTLTGIIINSKTVLHRPLLEIAENMKFIGRLGSGLEIVDLDSAAELGIHVFNSPEGNRNAVAEHVIGMLLALSNKLIKADKMVRSFSWNRELCRGFEIEGKTFGIIGLGNVGSSLARKLSSLSLNVISYDKYKEQFDEDLRWVRKVDLQTLVKESDIISLHVPLTQETFEMINEKLISNCKDGIIIINTSRGNVLRTRDLLEGLKSGKVGGACLDVFENERPELYSTRESVMYRELFDLNNVVLSPHVAGWTKESLFKIANTLVLKIESIKASIMT